MQLSDLIDWLEQTAPPPLAESWDNVGLLIGDRRGAVGRVLTCLTLTSDVAAEAIEQGAELIVTHHPVLFRAVQRLTTDTVEGRMLLDLIRAGVAVYSPHTAFDSAVAGINQELAGRLGLAAIRPLRPALDSPTGGATATPAGAAGDTGAAGAGRFGDLTPACSGNEFVERVRQALGVRHLQYAGDVERSVCRAAVACGAGGEFLKDAVKTGCDALVTGEARFHTCLEARAAGLLLVLPGHYATERPALEWLATALADRFPTLEVWSSRRETDPVAWSVT